MFVKMLNDDPRLGLKKGDVLVVKAYQYSPDDKYEVLKRVSDDYAPECTVYRSDVERLTAEERDVADKQWLANYHRQRSSLPFWNDSLTPRKDED